MEVGELWGSWIRVREAGILSYKERHSQNTGHPASVVTEKDATESSKGTDEICLYGHWGLDTIDIGRAMNGNTASRHGDGCVKKSKSSRYRSSRREAVRLGSEQDIRAAM